MKKDAGLKRGAPLKAKGKPKARQTPIKAVNRKRKTKRHADAFGPPGFVEFVHSYGCLIAREKGPLSGCGGPIEAAHVHGRSKGWKENVVGLCRDHHTAGPKSFHHLGSAAAFDKHWYTDLDLWAVAIYSRWLGIQQTEQP